MERSSSLFVSLHVPPFPTILEGLTLLRPSGCSRSFSREMGRTKVEPLDGPTELENHWSPSLEMAVSRGDYPQMTLIQISEIL